MFMYIFIITFHSKSRSSFIFFTRISDVERIENRRPICILLFTSGYSKLCITMQNLLVCVFFLLHLLCRNIFCRDFLHRKIFALNTELKAL